MWSPARSEFSLAPTLGYLALAVVAGLFVIDGDFHALSARLSEPRAPAAPAAALSGGAASPVLDGAAADLAALEAPELEVGIADASQGASVAAPAPAGVSSAAATSTAPAAAPAPRLVAPCLDPAAQPCREDALTAFRARLSSARGGKLGRPLRLSMFGDSVVATDEIPSRLRQLAVAELGDGGPGYVFAQAPHRFCAHTAVTRTSAGAWTTYAISTTSIRDNLYGFGGSTAQTVGGSITARVRGDEVTRVAVHYLAQPRGGSLEVLGDDAAAAPMTIEGRAEPSVARVAEVALPEGARKVTVRAQGPARLFGVVLERDRGAVVDNLGIVSVNSKNFARNDRAHFTAQVRARAPDLVLVMIGANEAQWLSGGASEMADYTTRFAALLTPIRQGGAACVVISPLDQVEIKEATIVSRKIAPRMADAQRAAAEQAGCAFFDTFRWMGGAGSALRWRRRGLLGGDYIHLTKKGSDALGAALFAELFGTASGGGAPP